MKITNENILEHILLSIDGELTLTQEQDLQKYLLQNADAQAIYNSHKNVQAQIISKKNINVFPGKLNLLAIANTQIQVNKKSEVENYKTNRTSSKKGYTIAAALIVIIGIGSIVRYSFNATKQNETIAQNAKPAYNSDTIKDLVAEQKDVNVNNKIKKDAIGNANTVSTNKIVNYTKENNVKITTQNTNNKIVIQAQPTQNIVNNNSQNPQLVNVIPQEKQNVNTSLQCITINKINILKTANNFEANTLKLGTLLARQKNNYTASAIIKAQTKNEIQNETENKTENESNNKLLNTLRTIKKQLPKLQAAANQFRTNGLEFEIEFVTAKQTKNYN